MGGKGLWADTEQDGVVLRGGIDASRVVAAARAIAGEDREATRQLLLAQVSDATGWNPAPTEVQYAMDHAARAVESAQASIAEACQVHGATHVAVDITTGMTTWEPPAPVSAPESPLDAPPFEVGVPSRPATITWTSIDAATSVVTANFQAGDEPAELKFPWDAEALVTVPAMSDSLHWIDAADLASDPLGVPLPAGVVRLDATRWLVEDQGSVHLAARLSKSDRSISFRDETAPLGARWRFLVHEGDEAGALALARATNEGRVDVRCEEGPAGWAEICCCCGSTDSRVTPALLLVALAWPLRRREPRPPRSPARRPR